jgi:hypothetical protein
LIANNSTTAKLYAEEQAQTKHQTNQATAIKPTGFAVYDCLG